MDVGFLKLIYTDYIKAKVLDPVSCIIHKQDDGKNVGSRGIYDTP